LPGLRVAPSGGTTGITAVGGAIRGVCGGTGGGAECEPPASWIVSSDPVGSSAQAS